MVGGKSLVDYRLPAQMSLQHAQKRKGDFSREISPSLFRFSEIWLWFQITTLVTPESFGTHELAPAFTSLFYDHTRRKSFPTAIRSSCLD
jgi:hypothetical protein